MSLEYNERLGDINIFWNGAYLGCVDSRYKVVDKSHDGVFGFDIKTPNGKRRIASIWIPEK